MDAMTPIIDAQVHCYARDSAERPWAGPLPGPPQVTGDDMVAFMNSVGVDGALLVSPWALYRFDGSYAVQQWALHPGRFALIKPFDPADPAVAERVQEWARQPGAVGARLMLGAPASEAADPAGVDRIVRAATAAGLPVNVLCWGNLEVFEALAMRHGDAQFVIDHLGLRQPFAPPVPASPFAALPEVVALARFAHVAIKVSGACTLSHEPFPFDDLWTPLGRMIDAFGIERCLWGTDWTRAVELVDPRQSVLAFRDSTRLSSADRAALMGGSLAQIYGWQPAR